MVAMDTKLGRIYCAISDVRNFRDTFVVALISFIMIGKILRELELKIKKLYSLIVQ